jgi:hypothetical protein
MSAKAVRFRARPSRSREARSLEPSARARWHASAAVVIGAEHGRVRSQCRSALLDRGFDAAGAFEDARNRARCVFPRRSGGARSAPPVCAGDERGAASLRPRARVRARAGTLPELGYAWRGFFSCAHPTSPRASSARPAKRSFLQHNARASSLRPLARPPTPAPSPAPLSSVSKSPGPGACAPSAASARAADRLLCTISRLTFVRPPARRAS